VEKKKKDDIEKVAIYSRKSRPEETEQVLKRQIASLIDLCVKNKWDYEVFPEVGSSQEINPELDKMLKKVQSFHFDAVVVTEHARLGRNDVVRAKIKEILANYAVKLVTPTQILDLSTQEGSLYSDMQTLVDKQEYLSIKKRLIRGKRQSAKEGNWVSGRTPVGYSYNRKTKRLEPNEDATIIKRIFSLYIQGFTTPEIERIFLFEGILTPNGVYWDKARISNVLSNPVYKGTAIYGKTKASRISKKPSGGPRQFKTKIDEQIIVENAHEPIISLKDWQKAEAIRKSRLTKPPSARIGKNYFTGLIKCALCGRTHSFQRAKQKTLRIASCQTRHYSDNENYTMCPNKGVKYDLFETVFFATFSQYVHELDRHIEYIQNNMSRNRVEPINKKQHFEDTLKKIDRMIKRVQNGYRTGIYNDEEAGNEIKQLRNQREVVENQLKELDNTSNNEQLSELQKIVNNLKSVLNGTSHLETKEINQLFADVIDHIEYKRVGDHRAKIEMKIHYSVSPRIS